MSLFNQLIQLIDVIIWPLTLLTILGWFKNELRSFFGNLKKIEAGADGIVLESFEAQLSKARDLFSDTTVSKSSTSIDSPAPLYTRDKSLSPALQLKQWHQNLSDLLQQKAKMPNTDVYKVIEKMKSSGLIKFGEYQKITQLLKTTSTTAGNIRESAIEEIREYLNALIF